jgi:membrane fusion protein (multidrug efflux system)
LTDLSAKGDKNVAKRIVVIAVCCLALFAGILALRSSKGGDHSGPENGSRQIISASKAVQQEWQPRIEAVGTLSALRGADLSPEVGGIVSRIYFTSGAEVKTGSPLLELDATADAARLQGLNATADLAKKIYLRDQEQFKVQAIGQAVLDTDLANLQNAEAQAAEQQALIDKKFIRAPFDGRLGIRMADLGQYLKPGSKIVTLQALDPIYVDFGLPQKAVSQISAGRKVSVRIDAFPGQVFSGDVSAIDPKLDAVTRSVQVRATVQNPRRLLLPGMLAAVTIDTGRPHRLVTIPQAALSFDRERATVFVVEAKEYTAGDTPGFVVEQRVVSIGETKDDQVAILDGLRPGEIVVTSDRTTLRNGTPIIVSHTMGAKTEKASGVRR